MKLWDFLKSKMLIYGDDVAFCNGSITYNELINIVESAKHHEKDKLKLAYGKSKQEQAIKILQILACGNVCVPITDSYREEQRKSIEDLVLNCGDNYPELSFVMFTSGTTGRPKGVMLSHKNIISNIKGIEGYFNVKRRQKILICRPLVHIAVLTGELLFGLCKGLQIDFYEEEFQPKRLASYIDNNDVAIMCCTPTLIYHLSKYLVGQTLKSVVLSGERLNSQIADILKDKYRKIDFYNAYGLTENSPRVSVLLPNDFFKVVGSVGKPILNTKIKVENGELMVKSKSVMQGYFNDSCQTRQKLENGFLRTGDSARIDEDGYLYILGRKDEMIIRSGLNIYPQEVENVINSIEGVENCLVYGENDINYGQKLCLKVVCRLDIKALRKQLLERLPEHLMPSKILVVESLDLTISGKVKRN